MLKLTGIIRIKALPPPEDSTSSSSSAAPLVSEVTSLGHAVACFLLHAAAASRAASNIDTAQGGCVVVDGSE